MAEKKKKVVVPKEVPIKQEKNSAPANFKKIKSQNTFIAMVIFEGKEGYRISNWPSKEALAKSFALPANINQAPVKEIKWFIVDHIKGTVTEEK